MKSKTIKYAMYFVFLAVAGILIYHFYGRWWVQQQVDLILFKGLTKDQISSITGEWKKKTNESAEWRKNVVGAAFVGVACGNDENIIRAFLRVGYSPNSQTREGVTPLHCAAGNGNFVLVKDFVAAGADLKARTTEDELLPLHYAASSRQWDVVRFFVKKGISIDEPSKHGTAVMVVANDEIVRRISNNMGKRGKDTQRQNESLTASVGVLASLGAKLDTVAPDGTTLMHYAARAQEPVLMDTLATKHGLLANVKNLRGETPLMFAFRE
jgi:ankyrin repeat protein